MYFRTSTKKQGFYLIVIDVSHHVYQLLGNDIISLSLNWHVTCLIL